MIRNRTFAPERIAFALFLTALLCVACNQGLEKASNALIDRTEARWKSNPIPNYRIVVDVKRPDEFRRNDITVRQGHVKKAFVQYWDSRKKIWDNTIFLNESQALAFTVEGLFDTVRLELENSGRPVVRVAVTETPPYLQRIVLGQFWQNNQAVPNSQATVTVQQFETLQPAD